MADARRIPAPKPDPDTKPYWDAAAAGQLLLRRCAQCGEAHHPPRPICPRCMSDRTEWVEAKGTGAIYAFSVMRRTEPPYAIAYVELDEGVRMLTNIVECDLDAIRIGQRVRVAFVASDGGPPVPMFRPL